METSWVSLAGFLLAGTVYCMVVGSHASVINEFPAQADKDLRHAVIDNSTGNIFVGSVNWIYVLNTTLHLQKAISIGPKEDSLFCSPDPAEECTGSLNKTRMHHDSTIMGLTIDARSKVLIACSNRFYGYCFKVKLATLGAPTEIYMPIVSNNLQSPPVLLVGPGFRSEGVLYVGTTHGEGLPLYKDRVPMIAVRELDGFNIAHADTTTTSTIDLLPEYRENFNVHFIHSFSHGQYTYFLLIRRENPTKDYYKTKIARICQKDERFQSYIEIPFDCGKLHLLQDAYVGKAGKVLGQKLNVAQTDDLIFAAFAISLDGSLKTGRESAVCLYSIKAIEEKFLNTIRLCFEGQSKIGPAHLSAPVQCTRRAFPIQDDYCYEAGMNTPMVSTVKYDPQATYPLPNTKLSAITVKLTSDMQHTVAILGTADGILAKYSIDDHESMVRFGEEEDVGDSLPIHRDILMDKQQDNVYVMNDKQIKQIRITPDCSTKTTCGSCLSTGDPHCGWCTMDNSCVPRKDCGEADSEHGWLAYLHPEGCPVIKKLQPELMQYKLARSTEVSLSMNFLPAELGTVTLNCAIVGYGVTRKAVATPDFATNTIKCSPFSPLPNVPKNEAAINMELSVLVYSNPWVTTNITFYECDMLNSCISCADTTYPCAWCLEGGQCLPKATPCLQGAHSSLRIRRQAPPTAVALAPPSDGSSGSSTTVAPPPPPEPAALPGTSLNDKSLCPIIKSDKTQFLIPNGYSAKYSVQATSLRDFQLRSLKCVFSMGVDPIQVVNATHKYDTIKRQWTIDCVPKTLMYSENEPYIDVPFDVSWDSSKLLDNPNKIHVRVYKCSQMESSCGLCLLLDSVYRCGWCENKCMQQEKCTATWLPQEATCPNAQIIDFHPKSGSVNGGTNITVTGINLGKKATDLSVKVAGIECKLLKDGYRPAQSFICTTEPCNKGDTSGTIEVIISNNITAVSAGKFTFVDPVLADFSPQKGPLSGGTHVVISGDNLDLGSKITVSIDGQDCPVVRRNFTHLEFATSAQDKPLEGKVKVTIDGTEDNILGAKFIYVDDPILKSIKPTTALVSGGHNVTVVGNNFDAVANPSILIKVNDLVNITSNCSRDSPKRLYCTVPSLKRYNILPDTLKPPALIHYGFIMDGVLALHNMSYHDNFGPLRVFPDPVVTLLPVDGIKYTKGLTLTIMGKNLKVLKSVPETMLTVGGEECKIKIISDKKIEFTPPASLPKEALNKEGDALVKLEYGDFYLEIGYIQYVGSAASAGVIIGAVVGAVGFVILLVLLYFLIRRERRRRKKKTMPPPPPDNVQPKRDYEDDRYKEARNGPSADATEMVPLKADDTVYDEPDDGKPGKPFNVEDFLERVKSNRLRNSIKEVLIPRNRLDLGEIIGKGHFGCVYAAYLRDEELGSPEKVAVKTLQAYALGESFNQQSVELFLKEGVTMRHFDHLHVLKLLGVCFDEEAQPMVILPYMAKGDLRSYVKDKKKNFTARQLLMLARQVAEGMSYLASLNFVHRDLAARNCMIDEFDQVKVADFGLSRELYEKDYYSSKDLDRKGKMPIKWMALESLEDFVFTTKSDVWSFGVLLWELMMRGVTPYPDVDVFDVRNFLATGRRLRKPKYCPDNIYKIMLDCWHAEPAMRPSFTDLVNRIELMLNPQPKTPNPAPKEQEQIYMNLSVPENHDYLQPVDNSEGTTVGFVPK